LLSGPARPLLHGTAIIAFGLGWITVVNAADLQWYGNGATPGGTGFWNTTLLRWHNGVSCCQAWNNAALDNAVFGGTAGAVTINAPVTAHNLTFNTSG
jgi:fibronectin-binding autotransporter adhesin